MAGRATDECPCRGRFDSDRVSGARRALRGSSEARGRERAGSQNIQHPMSKSGMPSSGIPWVPTLSVEHLEIGDWVLEIGDWRFHPPGDQPAIWTDRFRQFTKCVARPRASIDAHRRPEKLASQGSDRISTIRVRERLRFGKTRAVAKALPCGLKSRLRTIRQCLDDQADAGMNCFAVRCLNFLTARGRQVESRVAVPCDEELFREPSFV